MSFKTTVQMTDVSGNHAKPHRHNSHTLFLYSCLVIYLFIALSTHLSI